MERKHKIILITVGAILLAGGIGVLIYGLTKDKDQTAADLEEENPYLGSVDNTPYKTPHEANKNEDNNELGGVGSSWGNEVKPTFNAEKELSNPLPEILGTLLYPKTIASGGWGYANIRTSAEVNEDQGWWDPSDNLITTIQAGTPIGKILSFKTGLYNGYVYRWFKVKLARPVDGWFSDYTEGYVRADTVTFQPFTV